MQLLPTNPDLVIISGSSIENSSSPINPPLQGIQVKDQGKKETRKISSKKQGAGKTDIRKIIRNSYAARGDQEDN